MKTEEIKKMEEEFKPKITGGDLPYLHPLSSEPWGEPISSSLEELKENKALDRAQSLLGCTILLALLTLAILITTAVVVFSAGG